MRTGYILIILVFFSFPIMAEEEVVMCTADVKECADGSFVSRTAPDCAFAPCPDENKASDKIDGEEALIEDNNEEMPLNEEPELEENSEAAPIEEMSEEDAGIDLFHVHVPVEITEILDGDSFMSGEKKIDLWGIDAPAKGIKKYEEAKVFLELITSSAPISCKFIEEDVFGESEVMHCLADNADIGALMVLMGMAEDDKNASRGFYKPEQDKAKEEEIGIWEKEIDTFSTEYSPGEKKEVIREGMERVKVIDNNPLDGKASNYTIERNKVTRPVINR